MSDKIKKIYAFWDIQLNVTCPHCDHYFDLMDDDDIRSYSQFQPLERDTSLTTDYEITCPECEHEFVADFVY